MAKKRIVRERITLVEAGPLFLNLMAAGTRNEARGTFDYKQGYNDSRIARETPIIADKPNAVELVKRYRLQALGKPSLTDAKLKKLSKSGVDPAFMQRVEALCDSNERLATMAEASFNISMLLARRLNLSADDMGLERKTAAKHLTRPRTGVPISQERTSPRAIAPGRRVDGKVDKRFGPRKNKTGRTKDGRPDKRYGPRKKVAPQVRGRIKRAD
jgi:hypothetical protein